jgi:hypothetical protein
MMEFNIWQSFNGRVWLMTRRRQLTARQAGEQLAEVMEAEIELRRTAPGHAEYEIRPDEQNAETDCRPVFFVNQPW